MIDDWDDWFRQLDISPGVRIKALGEDDVDEVLRFIGLHDTDDHRAAQHSLEGYDFRPPYERAGYLVARLDEPRPVGISGYYIDDLEARGVYWLDWTYVNPFFQGEGIGSALLRATIETVYALGARKLFLSTSTLPKYERAVSFYRAHGFRQEGQLVDYYRDGEDMLILGRRFDETNW